jgi:hypothetical protein
VEDAVGTFCRNCVERNEHYEVQRDRGRLRIVDEGGRDGVEQGRAAGVIEIDS